MEREKCLQDTYFTQHSYVENTKHSNIVKRKRKRKPDKKWAIGMTKYFTKEALHVASMCEKRCSVSSVVRKIQP